MSRTRELNQKYWVTLSISIGRSKPVALMQAVPHSGYLMSVKAPANPANAAKVCAKETARILADPDLAWRGLAVEFLAKYTEIATTAWYTVEAQA